MLLMPSAPMIDQLTSRTDWCEIDERRGGETFPLDRIGAAIEHYREHGYMVIARLLPAEIVHSIRDAYSEEVLGSRQPMLRQRSMRYERNLFDEDGFLRNPIFNIQDLETRSFGAFKRAVFAAVTHRDVRAVVESTLQSEIKVVQTMLFEGATGTWPHQDSYYQDSAEIGRATAGWFALTDIHPGAGRFYVCPGTHRMAVVRNAGALNVATGHEAYKDRMARLILGRQLRARAPQMALGDAIFWSSALIHGSLANTARGHSRLSLTAHYLRRGEDQLQFHSWLRNHGKLTVCNDVPIVLRHDQDRFAPRLVRTVAYHFPASSAAARNLAIRAGTALSRLSRRLATLA